MGINLQFTRLNLGTIINSERSSTRWLVSSATWSSRT